MKVKEIQYNKTEKMLFTVLVFRSLDQINECTYDPPLVSNGTFPQFMVGATVETLNIQSSRFRSGPRAGDETIDETVEESKLI